VGCERGEQRVTLERADDVERARRQLPAAACEYHEEIIGREYDALGERERLHVRHGVTPHGHVIGMQLVLEYRGQTELERTQEARRAACDRAGGEAPRPRAQLRHEKRRNEQERERP
jgi:hypothetical protein